MSKFCKIISAQLVFFIVLMVSLKYPSIILATIVVNELYPKPATTEKEWIELYNDTSSLIDISGWKLMDKLSSPAVIFEFLPTPENTWEIEANSYLVIELDSSKLNNAEDGVDLFDAQGLLVDNLNYKNSQDSLSFSKIINIENNQSAIEITSPTKGSLNISNNQETTEDEAAEDETTNLPIDNLIISSVLPCPDEGENESIQINNPNAIDITLENWQIADLAGNKIILTSNEIALKETTTQINLTKNIMNNTGDTIYLFDPTSNLVDELEFDSCDNVESGANSSTNNAADNTTEPENRDRNDDNSQAVDQSSNNIDTKENDTSTQNNLISENQLLINNNKILKIANHEKLKIEKDESLKSKRIVLKRKIFSKTHVISVIIGGSILIYTSLFFIKNAKD